MFGNRGTIVSLSLSRSRANHPKTKTTFYLSCPSHKIGALTVSPKTEDHRAFRFHFIVMIKKTKF